MSLAVKGLDSPQILHLDRMCNECGNCTAFCPYDSSPYREKLTLYSTAKEFDESSIPGFLHLGGRRFKVRLHETLTVDLDAPEPDIPTDVEKILWSLVTDYDYLLPAAPATAG